MKAPESICILRLSALGDVCNAVATVQAIQTQYPDAKVTWIVGKLEFNLVEGLKGVEFIVFDKSQGKDALKKLKDKLRQRHFDALLHMQVAARANRLALMVSATRKIGYDWKRAKEGHSIVVNERIQRLDPRSKEQHVLDSFMSFAMKIGVEEDLCYPPKWNIPVSEADEEFARLTIPSDTKAMVICPAASKKERCWLPERYVEVAHFCHRKGISVILCGGPGELDHVLSQDIIKQSRIPINNLIGKTSIKQLYALLGRALFVLAPDTGPLHLANAAGTPAIGLYAHSNPMRTGPYNSLQFVASSYEDYLMRQFGKKPNQMKWGQRVYGESLMEGITIEQVYEKIDALLLAIAD